MARHAGRQLDALCAATGLDAKRDEIRALFREMARSWGDERLDETPLWSGISEDCSPAEFSVVFGGSRPELRFLVEAHAPDASPRSYWAAGEALTARLRGPLKLETARLDRVADLFLPTGPDEEVFFAAYHAVVFWPDKAPMAKIYLNPAAHGRAHASEVAREAFERLGVAQAWSQISPFLDARHVQVASISVDLSPGEGGRVKVYLQHRGVSLDHIEQVCALAVDYTPGDARRLFSAVAGPEGGDQVTRSVVTTHHLTEPFAPRPGRVALHVPAWPYSPDEVTLQEGIRGLLASCGIAREPYDRCVAALAPKGLAGLEGLHSWVSLQRHDGHPRVTTYFCPMMFIGRFGRLSLDPERAWPRPVARPDEA